jgi:hypothetical protein
MSDITWHQGEPKQDGLYIVAASFTSQMFDIHTYGNYGYTDNEVRFLAARWLQGEWHAVGGLPGYWTSMEVLKWAALQTGEGER